MPKIKFIKDYKACYRKGDTKEVTAEFAYMLINAGFAKSIDSPPKHKMIEKPEKEKRHYYVG